jgi:hypothetical protein
VVVGDVHDFVLVWKERRVDRIFVCTRAGVRNRARMQFVKVLGRVPNVAPDRPIDPKLGRERTRIGIDVIEGADARVRSFATDASDVDPLAIVQRDRFDLVPARREQEQRNEHRGSTPRVDHKSISNRTVPT